MKKFDEANHPRAAAGTFTDKAQTTPDISLHAASARMPNYDSVEETAGATWHYDAEGQPHRTDGPALLLTDGDDHAYYLHGQHIVPPGDDIDLGHVTEDGTQHWTSGGGNTTVTVEPDGKVSWRRDGDLHRTGGPAVIDSDGTQHWYLNDKPVPAPLPAEPTVEKKPFGPDGELITITGAKHVALAPGERNAAAVRTAANIRTDLAAAVAAGVLNDGTITGAKYTVRTKTHPGFETPTITITVDGLQESFITPQRGPLAHPGGLTHEALHLRQTIRDIAGAYNKVTHDTGTDYLAEDFDLVVHLRPTTTK
ncbi:hypothetical protein [Frigoribacterium sp. SL97]|uniref:hypothetical protein n=1 Tax=Frigoribacterium sp. SL97 TaxID=2994664 RepID=UPI00226EB2C4|nr:hypothetical protein [Frigoribacterium sp. SL97]WAC50284.1 hypothetical protein OVA02_10315 [Frigoribacterium sp. SL97]